MCNIGRMALLLSCLTIVIGFSLAIVPESVFAQDATCRADCREKVSICKNSCAALHGGAGVVKSCKAKCDREKKACYKICKQ